MQEASKVVDGAVIKIHSVRMKRITGWVSQCVDGGTPCNTTLTRTKKAAHGLAVAHAKAKHRGYASIEMF